MTQAGFQINGDYVSIINQHFKSMYIIRRVPMALLYAVSDSENPAIATRAIPLNDGELLAIAVPNYLYWNTAGAKDNPDFYAITPPASFYSELGTIGASFKYGSVTMNGVGVAFDGRTVFFNCRGKNASYYDVYTLGYVKNVCDPGEGMCVYADDGTLAFCSDLSYVKMADFDVWRRDVLYPDRGDFLSGKTVWGEGVRKVSAFIGSTQFTMDCGETGGRIIRNGSYGNIIFHWNQAKNGYTPDIDTVGNQSPNTYLFSSRITPIILFDIAPIIKEYESYTADEKVEVKTYNNQCHYVLHNGYINKQFGNHKEAFKMKRGGGFEFQCDPVTRNQILNGETAASFAAKEKALDKYNSVPS